MERLKSYKIRKTHSKRIYSNNQQRSARSARASFHGEIRRTRGTIRRRSNNNNDHQAKRPRLLGPTGPTGANAAAAAVYNINNINNINNGGPPAKRPRLISHGVPSSRQRKRSGTGNHNERVSQRRRLASPYYSDNNDNNDNNYSDMPPLKEASLKRGPTNNAGGPSKKPKF